MQEQKLCSKCQRDLPLSDFYIDHRRNKPRGQCKNCDREYKRSTVDRRTNRHNEGLAEMEHCTVPLLAKVPERNGQLREQELQLAYTPVAEHILHWLYGG